MNTKAQRGTNREEICSGFAIFSGPLISYLSPARRTNLLAVNRSYLHIVCMVTFLFSRMMAAVLILAAASGIAAAVNPFVGDWELTLPDKAAGWLGVEESAGGLRASMMMVAGSVEPVAGAKMEGDQLVLIREHFVEEKSAAGTKTRKRILETIHARISGDGLKLTSVKPHDKGEGEERFEFGGRRTPPMPPAPNLEKVKYGKPISLFNGHDLTGWRLTDPKADNGWIVEDGKLVNKAAHEEGKHKHYGNLRTDKEFEDFNLKLEVRVLTNGNSGIYLRGIYEVQVEESYGKPPTTHNMGAIYSRIQPKENASKPAGEWQKFDITLVDRHVTVVLNGVKVLSNEPVRGCTGGALWSDVSRPGPIYLQGDHTSIEYRNIVLQPVLKRGRRADLR